MTNHDLTEVDLRGSTHAVNLIRRHRDVRPNDGFLRQIADLDNKLRRERGQLAKKE